uniref:Uncharacterized protein n=1 Tax=Arundo donax TaxID=35708 RepID=A0A0A8ZUG1_ARUDO
MIIWKMLCKSKHWLSVMVYLWQRKLELQELLWNQTILQWST